MENRASCLSNITRTFRSRRCSARRRCVRRSRRSTPSPAPPTTSPTKATRPRANGSPRWRRIAPRSPRPPPAGPAVGMAAGVRAARRGDRPPPPAGRAARRAARRLRPGRDRVALRRPAGAARLLPTLGQSRSAGCCCISTASAAPTPWPAPTRSAPPCSSPTSGRTSGVDTRRGRLYLPEADCRRHGVDPLDLLAGKDSEAVHRLVADAVAWARELMRFGAPLVHAVPGRAGWELRLVVQGGLRVLERIDRARRRDPAAAAEARLDRRAGDRLAGARHAPREGRGERAMPHDGPRRPAGTRRR